MIPRHLRPSPDRHAPFVFRVFAFALLGVPVGIAAALLLGWRP